METTAQTQVFNHTRSNVKIENEQDYWSNKFGISKDELAAAAKAGESYTTAIEKYVKTVELTA